MRPPITLVCAALCLFSAYTLAATFPKVLPQHTPDGGIQPQVAVATDGTVHLVYFKGDPKAGDVFYVRSRDGGQSWSLPLRVNSQPNSAIAAGTVRGPQMALGKNNRIHVTWMGAQGAEPKPPGGKGAPMLYSRHNDAGDSFEPQRNLIRQKPGLDGGGSIAADDQGTVYVGWHAPTDPAKHEEEHRRIWVVRSDDDGKTFGDEVMASPDSLGICACCGMKMHLASGRLHILFRGAREMTHRDVHLLTSADGRTFEMQEKGKWETGTCPMSTAAFANAPGGLAWGAWEAQERVYAGSLGGAASIKPSNPRARQRFPGLAINRDGVILLAWTEGIEWNKTGPAAWELFDQDGKPLPFTGRIDRLPLWSFPAVFARQDGNFVVLY